MVPTTSSYVFFQEGFSEHPPNICALYQNHLLEHGVFEIMCNYFSSPIDQLWPIRI